MLDDYVLEQFIKNFYGYGNNRAKFFFIGMEEGGGNDVLDVSRRLEVWKERGCVELEDLAEYHRNIGANDWFGNNPRIQPTWNKLIRIVLAATGIPYDTEIIRNYQTGSLGTMLGDTCLLELLPLPSPNMGQWLYGDISLLPYLKNRNAYQEYVTNSRISHIKDIISQHYQPFVVVFYGYKYRDKWEKIAGIEKWEYTDGIMHSLRNRTLFIIARHPVARGITNHYFHQIGALCLKNLRLLDTLHACYDSRA